MGMSMKWVGLFAAFALVSAAAAAEGFSAGQRAAADQAASELRDQLDLQLVDYTTARFRNVTASAWLNSDSVRICGLVNAKNRSGGFTGWTTFAFSGGTLFMGEKEAIQIERLCADSDTRVRDTKDYSAAVTYKAP